MRSRWCSSARRRRPAARRSRTASAGSRARRASSPRSRSRRSRAPSSSGSAARSPSGVDATILADQIEAAQLRHHVVDDEQVERALGRAAAAPRAALVVSTTSWPASRSARPSAFRIFSSSSTSRMEPRWVMHAGACGRLGGAVVGGARAAGRCGSRCRWPGALDTAIVPPRPSTMFLAIGRPRPVPPRLVVKYGSKTLRQIGRRDADARSVTTMRDRGRASGARLRQRRSRPRRRAVWPFTAWRALTSRLTSAIRSRSASVVIGGSAGIEVERDRRAGRRRLRRGRRLAAERVEVGRRQLEPDRPGEVEHLVDDAVQPHHLFVDVGDRLAQPPPARRRAGAACAAPP